tara:strand:+ start:207 stop:620 length:414 start_codon:yes stop_codon:yes gene_type:complete
MAEGNTFYTTVVVVSLVILIVALGYIAYTIQEGKGDKEKVFPPIQSQCPDYWESNGTSCIVPLPGSHPNLRGVYDESGSLLLTSANTPGLDETGIMTSVDMAAEGWSMSKTSTCAKKDWANNLGLSWDTVANYNQCN